MRQIRIYIQNIMADIVIWKRNNIDIPVIENVIVKEEMKRGNTNVNIGDGSWKVLTVGRRPSKSDSIRMMTCAHNQFAIAIRRTWDFANFRLGQFLVRRISNWFWVSRMVLMMMEFLWMFCKKILRFFTIIDWTCRSLQNEAISTCFHRSQHTFWCAIPYWNDVSRRDSY